MAHGILAVRVFLLFWVVYVGSTLELNHSGKLSEGHRFTLRCSDNSTSNHLSWWKGNDRLSGLELGNTIIQFESLSLTDIGNYTCRDNSSARTANKSFEVVFNVPARLDLKLSLSSKEGTEVTLTCSCTGFPLNDTVEWVLPLTNVEPSHIVKLEYNSTNLVSMLYIRNLTTNHGGPYLCKFKNLVAMTTLHVISAPTVAVFDIQVVGKSRIYVRWSIVDGNSKLSHVLLRYYCEASGSSEMGLPSEIVGSYIIAKLIPNTVYSNFSLEVGNAIGNTKAYFNRTVKTLLEDSKFIPVLSVKGFTSDTITLGWNVLQNLTNLYHFFKITVGASNGTTATHYETTENLYMVERLQPGTNYTFAVQACSSFTNSCDDLSNVVNGTTMDGISSAPKNVDLECLIDYGTQEGLVRVTWDLPDEPRGSILEYSVVLTGNSTYAGEDGDQVVDSVGLRSKTVQTRRVEFSGQLPNTYVHVSVCAKTRTRMCGASKEGTCTTPLSLPHKDELSKANWKPVYRKNKLYFMITVPHISSRNGSICCFRVVVVRLSKISSMDFLQSPDQLKLLSYEEVHTGSLGGAYVAELLDPLQKVREVMIGDDHPAPGQKIQSCPNCPEWKSFVVAEGAKVHLRQASNFHDMSLERNHRKRHSNAYLDTPPIHDGPLDSQSTYTAYLEAIVINEKNEPLRAQSKYFTPLEPAQNYMEDEWMSHRISSALLGSLVIILAAIFLIILCVTRLRRKSQDDEGYGPSEAILNWCHRLRGQHRVPCSDPIDLPPIPKTEIMAGFLDRHQDCDYGFQREFEMLPDRFSDRSCVESDRRENMGKNRYPDIKAYDQTRVVLNRTDGLPSSDYINANFVTGYKSRKRFICAQGPMECTVIDWWKMIWEQHITLILMLTNTEEYNKAKCARYWPTEGSNTYGDIIVEEVSEHKYSDYLVRRLKMARSSSQLVDESRNENREVFQYHYLVWKDFMAPEHPMGVVRFIKRANEIHDDNGPVLVHCSAGVGRTGTLVALDSLLSELEEMGCVTIFNTICDLRHQRNYLVQSLKQYIFIYRACMEMAQFGDTDIPISDLKSIIEKHNSAESGNSSIRAEFGNLSQIIEDRKPFSIGSSTENHHRNRHENVIPYDRSRVILSPLPSSNNEVCTYINASCIEGYHISEQFIMTQDPLSSTVCEFWRMVVEQNVRSIVMLSDIGEDACPRYWPEKDQETSHDYIKVKYMQSQSFPYYYRREFTITNSKTEDSFLVTQFQYNGWPVGINEVPESARGLVELIDTTFKHKEASEPLGPRVVHCSAGADRSCIFVALAILVQQMLNESVIDIFNVVRNLRAQRQGLFQNFAQYELLYRGLLTYSELHMINGNTGF